mgnify:CR=1 FL=1
MILKFYFIKEIQFLTQMPIFAQNSDFWQNLTKISLLKHGFKFLFFKEI